MAHFGWPGRLTAAAFAAAAAMLAAAPAGASAGYSSFVLSLHPRAYWQLGELSGTTAFDSSPNHSNAVYEGSPLLGQPGAITGDPTTSVEFAGEGQDVVWHPRSSYRGDFTVVAWIKNLGSTGNAEQTFFDTRTPTAEYSFDFKINRNRLKVDIGDGTKWFTFAPGIRYNFSPGTWYQVAAVVRSTYVCLYVDGQQIGREIYGLGTGTPLLYSPSHPVYLAANPRYPYERFFGQMDQVTIFRRALFPNAINAIYQSGIAP